MLNRSILFFALCAFALACGNAGERSARVSIAVVPFGTAGSGPAPPVDVAGVIRTNLASSGYAPLETAELPSHPTRVRDVRFEDWQRIEADYLVVGVVARVHDGGHEVEFHLLDTGTQQALVAYMVPSAPDALAETARAIARMIEQRLTRS